MSDWPTCFGWVLPHEAGTPPNYEAISDPARADPFAKSIAGLNSAAFPIPFAHIASLPLADRPDAISQWYKETYWNPYMEQIASNAVAAYLLDSMVNQGQGTGVKLLQTALQACGQELLTDGHLGPVTVSCANSVPAAALLSVFQTVRKMAYRDIGGPNLGAWLNRAALVPPFA